MTPFVRAALIAIFVAFHAPCQAQEDAAAKIDDLVSREMNEQHIPGVALAVIKDGKVVLAKGYGFANVKDKTPMKPETDFPFGLVSKPFTATAVMMLVEDGKIRLNESICKYLTNAPRSWTNIKVYHLLNQTSGLGDFPPDFDLHRNCTKDEMFARLSKSPLKFRPGQLWNYSNVGYVMLGFLAGEVCGKPYGQFLQDQVFKVSGMTSAGLVSRTNLATNLASGYQVAGGAVTNLDSALPALKAIPEGSLCLSVSDVAKWDEALWTGKLLKKPRLEQMWVPARLTNRPSELYGFGWFLGQVGDDRLIGHEGSWPGFESGILRYVDNNLSVVAFDNLTGSNLDKIMREVAAAYVPKLGH